MSDLENAFNGGGENNYYKKDYSSYKKDFKSNKNKGFDKNTVKPLPLVRDKINFSINYRCYAFLISSLITNIRDDHKERIINVLKALSSKGYLLRGLNAKDIQNEEIKSVYEEILNEKNEIEMDKLFSVNSYIYDVSKIKSFSIIKGLISKYTEMKDIVKSFMCRDLEIVYGENINKPVSFAIMLMDENTTAKEATDYKVSGSLNNSIKFLKLIGKPFYNIANEEEYQELLNKIDEIR